VDLPTQAAPDRVLGAWLGRAAGCLLGKPVEKIPRVGIRAILDDLGEWPLRQYFTEQGLDPAVGRALPVEPALRPTSLRENIAGMPEDDDLNYPLLNLALLERLGRRLHRRRRRDELAGEPARRARLHRRAGRLPQPARRRPARPGRARPQPVPGVDRRADPRRRVRLDPPGRPRDAAMLAFTDASLSHVREGIYGEMWVAGACAAAVVADDLRHGAARGERPASRRSSGCARRSTSASTPAGIRDLDAGLDLLHDRYGHLHWVHVLNNAATISWALTSTLDADGRPDFGAAIARASMAGWDTDSAGATVGSIAGGLLGARALPPAWIDPMQDRYATSLPGFDGVSFTELAARTAAHPPDRRGCCAADSMGGPGIRFPMRLHVR
jgi:hypothetical protein